jgi:hypothetical protein
VLAREHQANGHDAIMPNSSDCEPCLPLRSSLRHCSGL